jgi:hypothetical protein
VNAVSAVNLVWNAALFVFAIVFVVAVFRRRRRRSLAPGPGASGAVYDLLNQDKRHAIELIVEQKAEARDPEHADDIVE